MTAVPRVRHLTADGWTDGDGAGCERRSPSDTSRVVARWQEASVAQVGEAVAGAAAGARSWAARSPLERAEVLRRAAARLDERAEEIGALAVLEVGKPVGESVGEVRRAAAVLRYHAGAAELPTARTYASDGSARVLVQDHPRGVVGLVTPWNFPLAIPAWKLAPALVHGNAVVWKPSPESPVTATVLAEVLVEAGVPAGVLTLVHGGPQVGSAVVGDAGVTAVSFTGSGAVGAQVVATCAGRGAAVQAELGGKNSVVVADDADLDAAVAAVVAGAFGAAGQKCTATSRVVVQQAVAEEFVVRLARATEQVVVGDPADPATVVGPLVTEGARTRVAAAVEATLGAPGVRPVCVRTVRDELAGRGWYAAPVVVEVDRPAGVLWDQEVFGPAVAVLRVGTYQDALDAADAGPLALAAAVHTDDRHRIDLAVRTLEVGMLTVNGPTTGGHPHVPFGGWDASGYGPREQGEEARAFYTRSKTVLLRA